MDWKPLESLSPDAQVEDLLLWNGERVFVGWLSDDGWHDGGCQGSRDKAVTPEPTHFASLPEPPSSPVHSNP